MYANQILKQSLVDFVAGMKMKILMRVADAPNGNRRWVCECPQCGDHFTVSEYKIRMRYVQDCGCAVQVEQVGIRRTASDWEGEAVAA